MLMYSAIRADAEVEFDHACKMAVYRGRRISRVSFCDQLSSLKSIGELQRLSRHRNDGRRYCYPRLWRQQPNAQWRDGYGEI